jgi:glycosyl-4,4'-diaponeurosporenoate acyltransferase
MIIYVVNTFFWIFLHFGIGFLVPILPENIKIILFNKNRRIFIVSEKEIKFYRKIRLHVWKDKLPQFNKGFNKRNLPNTISKEYLELYIYVTCQAEFAHYMVIILGYFSVFFSLLTKNKEYWIFILIATFIGLCNLIFSLIQRYNRFRLKKILFIKYKNK